jgi:hypothetical protein
VFVEGLIASIKNETNIRSERRKRRRRREVRTYLGQSEVFVEG